MSIWSFIRDFSRIFIATCFLVDFSVPSFTEPKVPLPRWDTIEYLSDKFSVRQSSTSFFITISLVGLLEGRGFGKALS
jgi:hypothetical protein